MNFRWSKATLPLLALLVPCLVWATPYENDPWVPGHLIVNLKASVGAATPVTLDNGIVSMGIPSLDELFTTYQVYQMKRLVPDGILARMKFPPDFGRLYVLYCPETIDVPGMVSDFATNSLVKSAEPDLLRRINRNPNDPLWSSQWDKIQMGCNIAWDYTTGDSTIIVCAIDTGTDWNHPDLTPNLWVNPGEDLDGDKVVWVYDDICGDPDDQDRQDNDGNDYVDDLIGWDFIDNIGGCAEGEDCDVEDPDPFGLEPHGTHTLGLMAARGNNATGVVGAGWNFKGMAIRAGYLADDGWGYMPQSATLPAINYAVAMGAKVISMSYGGSSGSSLERETLQAAWENGCILFASAGNDGTEQIQYPAGHPHVISVASTDNGDHLSSWSQRGTWLDLCAPGGNPGCWSTIIDGYGGSTWQGTSMASPNAAGTAALIWNLFSELTNVEVESLVLNNCQNISSLNPSIPPNKLGRGRISAPKMLASRLPHISIVGTSILGDNDGDGRLERNETGNLVITVANDSGWAPALNLRGRLREDDPHLTLGNDSAFFGDLMGDMETDNMDFPIVVSADAGIEGAYWARFMLDLTAEAGFETSLDFQVRIEWPALLLVADDSARTYHAQYEADLESLGVIYDKWSVLTDGSLATATIAHYREIFWVCGEEDSLTLTSDDQASLGTFLDGGGKLALFGRRIDRDLYDETFYANYLHCASLSPDSAAVLRSLTGVTGDAVSDGTTLLLAGSCSDNGNRAQSRIVPLEGATAIYTYNGDRGNAAIRYGDTTTYQVVYFAFALEAACGSNMTTHHRVVIERILQWFNHPLSVVPPVNLVLPQQYALLGGFPNPFNPTATIRYDVRAPGHVALKVYDIQGRLVQTLADGMAQVGSHSVRFDASSLGSGIYFVQMTAPGFSDAKKMILLK